MLPITFERRNTEKSTTNEVDNVKADSRIRYKLRNQSLSKGDRADPEREVPDEGGGGDEAV